MAGQPACGTGAAACIAVEHALAFVAGRLGLDERAAVERRIAACAGCRAAVDQAAASISVELVRETGHVGPGGPARDAPARTEAQRPRAGTAGGEPRRVALVDDRGAVIGELRRPAPHGDAGLIPGEVVGRYVVERPLGAGGMGVVSLARDPELRRPVVIKLVHPAMGGEGSDEFEARLRREAQAMAQVSHSNVVQIFDIGRRGDRVFLAMEFVDGQTLGEWLRERHRTPDEILRVLSQAGAGLAAAHRAGLIHRDFKPSNVLVGRNGAVKVTDFGLARSVTPDSAAAAADAAGSAGATRQLRAGRGGAAEPAAPAARAAQSSQGTGVYAVLTQANAILGTPAYMAPEQAAGALVDARCDQYALALTLLDGLLGQPPNRRRAAPGDRIAVDLALRAAQIDEPVRDAIARALAPDPAARFPEIDDFLRAIAPAARPARSRRALFAVIGAALCAIAAAAWFALDRSPAPIHDPVRPEPGCVATLAARWLGAPRARVVTALAAAPRPFADWDAARVAAALDAAVETLGTDELTRCRAAAAAAAAAASGSAAAAAGSAATAPAGGAAAASPSSGSAAVAPGSTAAVDGPVAAADDCFTRRAAALTAAVDELTASPPPVDPWPLVRAITRCDAALPLDVVALRRELTAEPGLLRSMAVSARDAADRIADDPLAAASLTAFAADALEAAGARALATGDAAAAAGDFERMATVGERSGDDAVRGRALLRSISAGRWRGSHADARREVDQLHAMLTRHGDAPRDTLAAALLEGDAFTDLGDVAAAFAAWDRAASAATALTDLDATLAVAIGRARSLHILRFDLIGARAAATAALDTATTASPLARAGALAIAADLALAAGDGAAAKAALDAAAPLDPIAAAAAPHRLRVLRARAALGDAEAALAELLPAVSDDALTTGRIGLARGQILLDGGHASEAVDVLDALSPLPPTRRGNRRPTPPLAIAERLDLALAAYEAHLSADDQKPVRPAALLDALHPRAPQRARFDLLDARHTPEEQPVLRNFALNAALSLLRDAAAAPLAIADIRWQLAQSCMPGADCRDHALSARAVFAAANRTADVAAIDRWLAARSIGSASSPPPPPPPRREAPGPQP